MAYIWLLGWHWSWWCAVARAAVVAGVVGIATGMKNGRGTTLSNPRALVTK